MKRVNQMKDSPLVRDKGRQKKCWSNYQNRYRVKWLIIELNS
jgi:hypothetical protein